MSTLLTCLIRQNNQQQFNGERAYNNVLYQTSLGPRTIGSDAHAKTISWLNKTLNELNWETEIQTGIIDGTTVHNLIAKRGTVEPWVIIGAHFDSRSIADHDPDPAKQLAPIIGANDGASGVAVLLELARVLPEKLNKTVWLVFFDAEDDGNYQGKEWILGSSFFVEKLLAKPDKVVIIDMIGDANLQVYWERNSDPMLFTEIWKTAAKLGYEDYFVPQYKYRILDDHTPFIEAGIPAVDIIDFDYPYYHTSEDTADKVSPQSLAIIGNTLLHWLLSDEAG